MGWQAEMAWGTIACVERRMEEEKRVTGCTADANQVFEVQGPR